MKQSLMFVACAVFAAAIPAWSQPTQLAPLYAPACPVRLNEVMINPRFDEQGEFIELYNASSTQAVDIRDWTIEERGAGGNLEDEDEIVDFTNDYDLGLSGTVIPPGGYALIVDSGYNGAYNYDISMYHPEPLENNFIMVTTDDGAIGDGFNNEADSFRIVTDWKLYNKAVSPYQVRSLSWTAAQNFHAGVTQPSFEWCSAGKPIWRKCTYGQCTPARTNSWEE